MKRPYLHRPKQSTISQLGRDPQRAYLRTCTKLSLLGAAFCKGEHCRGRNHSPKACLLRKAMLAYFSPSPLPPIRPKIVCAASGSVGTAAWLVVS